MELTQIPQVVIKEIVCLLSVQATQIWNRVTSRTSMDYFLHIQKRNKRTCTKNNYFNASHQESLLPFRSETVFITKRCTLPRTPEAFWLQEIVFVFQDVSQEFAATKAWTRTANVETYMIVETFLKKDSKAVLLRNYSEYTL